VTEWSGALAKPGAERPTNAKTISARRRIDAG
jgi:hypothetical protein